jgi:hypothetical protein
MASPVPISDPSSIIVLLMEKISQQAVDCFENEGFTVRQAVRFLANPLQGRFSMTYAYPG